MARIPPDRVSTMFDIRTILLIPDYSLNVRSPDPTVRSPSVKLMYVKLWKLLHSLFRWLLLVLEYLGYIF